MLTKDEIQVLIVKRVFALCDGANDEIHREIQALLAVLNDGRRLPVNSVTRVLDAAGIPYALDKKPDGIRFDVPEEWLKARGAIVTPEELDENGEVEVESQVEHPKLKDW